LFLLKETSDFSWENTQIDRFIFSINQKLSNCTDYLQNALWLTIIIS